MDALADHLWQSTCFAVVAWLLALFVRKDFAHVRYYVWFAASVKFLVPFAVLDWIGSQFILELPDRPTLLSTVQQMSMPLSGGTISIESFSDITKYALVGVWILGSTTLLVRWIIEWLRTRALLRTSRLCDVVAPIDVRRSDQVDAPAVIGILNPVVLLPSYTLSTLTPLQIDAVISHELWHVRRRDNLTASLQRLNQVLFWFHPLVWWIGSKLLEEREHACDEGVIKEGYDPFDYAGTLLRVCRHSVSSRLMFAASVAGGDLSARVRAIVSHRLPSSSALIRRAVLGAALVGWIGMPVASGMLVIATSELDVAAGASSIRLSRSGEPSFIVMHDDYVYARNVSLRELVSEAYSVHPREVRSHGRMLDSPRYDVELRVPRGSSGDPQRLVADLLKRQFNLELVERPRRT